MRIRTITVGIDLDLDHIEEQISSAGEFLNSARDRFRSLGIDVQTVRIATQNWEDLPLDRMRAGVGDAVEGIEGSVLDNGMDFLSMGQATNPNSINLIPSILETTSITCCSASIANSSAGVMERNIIAAASVVKEISKLARNGSRNFMFAAAANCPADTPFFPAAYHGRSGPCFTIGLESGDVVFEAASRSRDLGEFKRTLSDLYFLKLEEVQDAARELECGYGFHGIDLSFAPGLDPNSSIALAVEKLIGNRPFGSQGTLAVCAAITSSLKDLDIDRCGYSGLMLPVMEDIGLVQGAEIGAFDIQKLLLYSSVCGTGLDAVPIPGDITELRIAATLRDVAFLSEKLSKPLSARLLPIPGKGAGDMTELGSPYLLDCSILGLI